MPEGEPKGAVVVIQEIFGVNAHIREVADGYATAGYVAIAPALFDRQEANVQLGYADEADWGKGMRLAFEGFDRAAGIADMQAAVDAAGEYGNVGLVGYCFGGLMAWIAADEVPGLAAVSGYYGGMIGQEANRTPACPVILHFGEKDAHIPAEQIDLVRPIESGQKCRTIWRIDCCFYQVYIDNITFTHNADKYLVAGHRFASKFC